MLITIALADDHQLVRKGIKLLLDELNAFEVVAEASNGKELIEKIADLETPPALALIDVNMPVMDGVETVKVLTKKYPEMGLIALSVSTDLRVVREMIRSGANAYLNKDSDSDVVRRILLEVHDKGFYYDQNVIDSLKIAEDDAFDLTGLSDKTFKHASNQLTLLSEREKEFLKLSCTEMTYKEIGHEMGVTPRTVDGYRESLFAKLSIRSRTGLVIFAIQAGLFKATPSIRS